MPTVKVVHGCCLAEMRAMAERGEVVQAIVTDPPYELSNDGKASPHRVATEMLFPQHPHVQSLAGGECHLIGLAREIAGLHVIGLLPRPAASVPVASVALNEDASHGQVDIEYAGEGAVRLASRNAGLNGEAETTEHLGDFALELGNTVAAHDSLDRVGCQFEAGGLGIGFRVGASGLPSLLRSSFPVVFSDYDIRALNDALSPAVGAGGATEHEAVARLHLGGAAEDRLSARAALVLLTVAQLAGAKLVRAGSGTSRLPAMLEARRIRVVSPATNRAISFNLLIHKQNIASTGFMGKDWDGGKVAFDRAVWRAAYDILPPGGHLLAFGGTRTYHRLASAIEDAGFTIRDCIMWVTGSGFPKSLNLAGDWKGWGTSLKPAWEPIVLARRPLAGTVAANVLAHGVGALNIDATRVPTDWDSDPTARGWQGGNSKRVADIDFGTGGKDRVSQPNAAGRWPANLVHSGDAEVEAAFAAFGETKSSLRGPNCGQKGGNKTGNGIYSDLPQKGYALGTTYADSGSVSRFFAKCEPSDAERRFWYSSKASKIDRAGSRHPTVKPIALMRWLVRLVTPPGGVVLDPFAGSGTTLAAALAEGFDAIGIEREEEYYRDCIKRIDAAQPKPEPEPVKQSVKAAPLPVSACDTLPLFRDLPAVAAAQ